MNKNLTEEYKDFILLHGDNLEQINQINHKVDMIFANPPYFLSVFRSVEQPKTTRNTQA